MDPHGNQHQLSRLYPEDCKTPYLYICNPEGLEPAILCRTSPRLISIGQLNTSRCVHLRPINDIVYVEPYSLKDERSYLRGRLQRSRRFQRLSRPYVATQLCTWQHQLVHQRYVHPGPLVLRTAPFKSLTPATDRDRTVSRRSEPSSRAALIGEQPNPWGPNTAPGSRHEPTSRCQTSPVAVDAWGRSACYPQGSFYPLSRWHFHSHTTGSLTPTFVTA